MLNRMARERPHGGNMDHGCTAMNRRVHRRGRWHVVGLLAAGLAGCSSGDGEAADSMDADVSFDDEAEHAIEPQPVRSVHKQVLWEDVGGEFSAAMGPKPLPRSSALS